GDGRLFALACQSDIAVWEDPRANAAPRQRLQHLDSRGRVASPLRVDLAPRGDRLVSVSADGRVAGDVRIWHLSGGTFTSARLDPKNLRRLEGWAETFPDLRFASDGKRVYVMAQRYVQSSTSSVEARDRAVTVDLTLPTRS
ncbi:MAG TPA: hypothetical protein VFH51_20540, partial [Myxococcota bacterium]|nr:hypothetical protein [Myxococcota bacterium]